MFNSIKKIVPNSIKKYYWRHLKQQQRAKKKRIKFDGKSPKEAFTFIYKTNYWSGAESISGGGSDLVHTQSIIKSISKLIEELNLQSILDIPCGDFLWMQYVDIKSTKYIGGDIVDELIEDNINKHGITNEIEFKVLDLLQDNLPKSDIIINRDCLVHLSFNDIQDALANVKNSKSKYLLTTTFPNTLNNKDITTGEWRTINLEKPPFNFPPPIKLINEEYNNPNYKDKSLGLWAIEDIVLSK